MARLPQPPDPDVLRAMLRETEDVVAVHQATRLVRVFTTGGRHQQHWNTFRRVGPLAHARFDPHPVADDAPAPAGAPGAAKAADGVLYFGLSVRTSIAEVFQAGSIVDRRTRAPHLVVLRPVRPLRLLDIAGLWPTRAGASQAISSGPKDRTQAWARAIRTAYPQLDGLWYRSSMDSGSPAVCLWDPPSGSALPDSPDVLLPLNHPGLDLPLGRICEQLHYTLLD
ncbi:MULTISPECIES: RES family NAD+ phosphorylase [Actinoalloteichus]|uniref:RES domain-containing protein n=1 Tax=Actinoalloteichus fjordicus TaxID=1612552 RepID=A0AAC9LA79_9PSEU|nr:MULTISPECIES: RES family NAD+ phosphorylase [Actinoalloteichus]APU14208.1 RES domain-containing protein [Actinoalloteichus fjordicus]APU20177.1 RES domain-containing protein [Actinoalloteichus sp. GBA129-24]